MKKHVILLILTMFGIAATAQHTHGKHHHSSQSTLSEAYALNIIASNDERFTIYVDGDMVNSMPQSRVVLDKLDYNMHDIYVVLSYPENKINMLTYKPINHKEDMEVHYDRHHKVLRLLMTEQYDSHVAQQLPAREVCSFQEVEHMLALLKEESFDSSRDKLEMDFVMNHNLVASHIMKMAKEFSFETIKKEFLKNAYPYCVDPENYEVVVNCLQFSSDKQELLEYIGQPKGI